MTDIERYYAICAEKGIDALLAEAEPDANFAGLAKTCLAGADEAEALGDRAKAERLRGASQYLIYLEFPHD